MKIFSAKKLIVFTLIAGFVAGVIPASAFTRIVKASEGLGQVGVKDLALEDIAILPNNPFHFMIGFSNSIKGFFISNPVREASFKLEISGRNAGELRKLLDWVPDNTVALSTSLALYESSLIDFGTKLRSLKASDLGEGAEKTLNKMTGRLLTQVLFVDDIRDSFTSSADKATLEAISDMLEIDLRFIGEKLDRPESFGDRIVNLMTERADAAITVRAAEILPRLVSEISVGEAAQSLKRSILAARQTLITNLIQAMQDESKALTQTETEGPTIIELIDQLAGEVLKAEIYALLR
ncbi:MAG: hypothetical protein Q7R62_03155 [bacterium]|nr:hypothetical protein [bacterium]